MRYARLLFLLVLTAACPLWADGEVNERRPRPPDGLGAVGRTPGPTRVVGRGQWGGGGRGAAEKYRRGCGPARGRAAAARRCWRRFARAGWRRCGRDGLRRRPTSPLAPRAAPSYGRCVGPARVDWRPTANLLVCDGIRGRRITDVCLGNGGWLLRERGVLFWSGCPGPGFESCGGYRRPLGLPFLRACPDRARAGGVLA